MPILLTWALKSPNKNIIFLPGPFLFPPVIVSKTRLSH